MRKLGISIYPEKASVEENKKYIELASKYGFSEFLPHIRALNTFAKYRLAA